MSEYERPSFRKEWWEEIREYLEEHSEEGFDPEDVKEFVKFCVNRRMESRDAEEEILADRLSEILKSNPELIDKFKEDLE